MTSGSARFPRYTTPGTRRVLHADILRLELRVARALDQGSARSMSTTSPESSPVLNGRVVLPICGGGPARFESMSPPGSAGTRLPSRRFGTHCCSTLARKWHRETKVHTRLRVVPQPTCGPHQTAPGNRVCVARYRCRTMTLGVRRREARVGRVVGSSPEAAKQHRPPFWRH